MLFWQVFCNLKQDSAIFFVFDKIKIKCVPQFYKQELIIVHVLIMVCNYEATP